MQNWLNVKVPEVQLGTPIAVAGRELGESASLYVCGITPYDATHIGHARTYLTFDYLVRLARATGRSLAYVQNVTDVDDPLLERAQQTGEDWRELAAREMRLFFTDMEALRVLPPDHYIGAVESIPLVVEAVAHLEGTGAAYRLDTGADAASEGGEDLYAAFGADPAFEAPEDAVAVFGENGGDPGRPGKADPLDPLVWRAAREGEPRWDGGPLGEGRPGWHIECAVIAAEYLGGQPTITGGGRDLAFPHHAMSTSHLRALGHGGDTTTAHVGMVGYEGHKMSKSRGNLVKVSTLRAEGVDPALVRVALAALHYAEDVEWENSMLDDAAARLALWRRAVRAPGDGDGGELADGLAARLGDDLDTPGALAALDTWAERRLAVTGRSSGEDVVAGAAADAVDALLGVDLR